MNRFFYFLTRGVLVMSLMLAVACKDDEPYQEPPPDDNNTEEPYEEIYGITINLSSNGNRHTFYKDGDRDKPIAVIGWVAPNNFYICGDSWTNHNELKGYHYKASLCKVGYMPYDGIYGITSIPQGGWSEPGIYNGYSNLPNKLIPCEKECGYVLKIECHSIDNYDEKRGWGNITPYIDPNPTYARIFVENSIVNTSNGVMGVKITYQYPAFVAK